MNVNFNVQDFIDRVNQNDKTIIGDATQQAAVKRINHPDGLDPTTLIKLMVCFCKAIDAKLNDEKEKRVRAVHDMNAQMVKIQEELNKKAIELPILQELAKQQAIEIKAFKDIMQIYLGPEKKENLDLINLKKALENLILESNLQIIQREKALNDPETGKTIVKMTATGAGAATGMVALALLGPVGCVVGIGVGIVGVVKVAVDGEKSELRRKRFWKWEQVERIIEKDPYKSIDAAKKEVGL